MQNTAVVAAQRAAEPTYGPPRGRTAAVPHFCTGSR